MPLHTNKPVPLTERIWMNSHLKAAKSIRGNTPRIEGVRNYAIRVRGITPEKAANMTFDELVNIEAWARNQRARNYKELRAENRKLLGKD